MTRIYKSSVRSSTTGFEGRVPCQARVLANAARESVAWMIVEDVKTGNEEAYLKCGAVCV